MRGKPWWALNRPRAKWAINAPKIVTPQFGKRGGFAFDEAGRYVVLQGNAWFWKAIAPDADRLPWAYLVILNSPIFESVLSQLCPGVLGGQYNINKNYINNVPIPNLSDKSKISDALLDELTALGKMIVEGRMPGLYLLDSMTAKSYGFLLSRMQAALAFYAVAMNEARFRRLYENWRQATISSSSVRVKLQHPTYVDIVAMGEPAIPFILAELRKKPSHIFWALAEITRVNPLAPSSAGNVPQMIESWLQWGREQGYES